MTSSSVSSAVAPRRVIVIDDDEVMLLSCRAILERADYAVEAFDNGADGLARLQAQPPPLLVVDLKMPRIDGLEVIGRTRQIDPDIVIIVITGYATIATAVDAMKAGAYDFLPKPFTPEELRLIIDRGFERWRLAREAVRLRREKEEAQRRFITFVSHQLKTPIAAVKQYLDVLVHTSGDELSDRTAEWIRRSQARLDEMLTLIQDWLQLARLERGELCQHHAATDLAPVLARVGAAHQGQAETAGVRIELAMAADLPAVAGDAASLGMLVDNLLSNAVKYSRRGGTVQLRLEPLEDGAQLVVADDGIGIPEDAVPRLFSEFYRVKSAATRDIPGTGLGLAICQRIAEDLGGRIEVTSTEGVGTTFTVRLRAAPPAVAPHAGRESEPGSAAARAEPLLVSDAPPPSASSRSG